LKKIVEKSENVTLFEQMCFLWDTSHVTPFQESQNMTVVVIDCLRVER
jgi:hypothetical protein